MEKKACQEIFLDVFRKNQTRVLRKDKVPNQRKI